MERKVNLKNIKKYVKITIFDVDNNILESKPGKKLLKHSFIIYVDLECLLLKINTFNNNPNKSYTTALQ